MERLATSWDRLEPRERWLLGSLVLLFLPLALAFLVAFPLMEQRDGAARQRAEATALLSWVQQRNAEWQAVAASGGPAFSIPEPVGMAQMESALAENGLRTAVSSLEALQDGRIRLNLEGVAFTDFARFLERVEPELGYRVSSLTITGSDVAGAIIVRLDLQPG